MRGIMRRISVNGLLWFGLMVWLFGQMMWYIATITDWNPLANPSSIGYSIYRYSGGIGAFVLFIGAAIKVIASLRSK